MMSTGRTVRLNSRWRIILVVVASILMSVITVISGHAAYATTSTSTIAVSTEPDAVAVNPVTNTIYVTSYGSNIVSVINGATNTVTSTITIPGPQRGVAVDPTTNTIYVASEPDLVSVINGATNTVTNTITVGLTPIGIAVDTSTDIIYVANMSPGTMSVIDGATNTVTDTIALESSSDWPITVAVDPSTDTIFVGNLIFGSVSVIDGATNTITALNVYVGSAGVAVDPSTNIVYVVSEDNSTLSLLTGATGQFIDSITLSEDPTAVAVDPSTDTIYIPTGENTVLVIDGATNTVINTITTGDEPLAVAVNTSTHVVYTADYDSNEVTAFTGVAPQASVTTAGSGTSCSSRECLDLSPGALSVGSTVPGTFSAVVGGQGQGTLPTAIWTDSTGSGAGWQGSIAASNFVYTGNWVPQGSAPALGSGSGSYTGNADGLLISVSVGSGGTSTSTSFTWVDNGGGSGSGTATNGTPAAVEQGVTIDFAAGTTYSSGTQYIVRVGTQSSSALELDSAVGSIVMSSGEAAGQPTFTNNAVAIPGGGVGVYGAAVPFLSAAIYNGLGGYKVAPGAVVTADASSWAATYVAQAQYTIVTGP